MNIFFKVWSYVFNPVFIPLAVSIWYLNYALGLSLPEVQLKVYWLGIYSIIIPLLLYFLLKTLGVAQSIHLSHTKERLIPLLVYGGLILVILTLVLDHREDLPLYYFYIGIMISTVIALILAIFKFKISLHMMAVSGALAFFVIMNIYLEINMVIHIAVISVLLGLTATSRLYLKAHSPTELIFGTTVGMAVQLIAASYYI